MKALRTAASVSFFFVAACAASPPLTGTSGEAPEVAELKARFPEFYEQARARLNAEFHGREVAARTQLGPGRWRVVVRLDIDSAGDVHGSRLLRSSGFNAIDEEAMAACHRVKQHLFPPEESIEADLLVHLPVQLVVEVP